MEEALQVLRTEPSTLPLKATFEGVMRGDRAQTKAAALELFADDFPDGESFYYVARALAAVRERHLRSVAQFESAGGRRLIDA